MARSSTRLGPRPSGLTLGQNPGRGAGAQSNDEQVLARSHASGLRDADTRDGQMTEPTRCNVLMIYPRFSAASFWNYSITAELLGARYPTIPLGLITLAAMLPPHWTIRLGHRNTEAPQDGDLDRADLVMTAGMPLPRADSLRL